MNKKRIKLIEAGDLIEATINTYQFSAKSIYYVVKKNAGYCHLRCITECFDGYFKREQIKKIWLTNTRIREMLTDGSIKIHKVK